jgi:molybdenum cofactor cytidylyltransferase
MTTVTAIFLAAGLSSRMGGTNKLLLEWKGRSLVEYTLRQLITSNVDEVVLVLGRDADLIRNLVGADPKLKIVQNYKYESGMTSSIQEGLNNAKGDAYMICLADMPFLSPLDYNVLIDGYSNRINMNKDIILPQFQGRRGNPVIFHSCYKEAILNHSETNGCSKIVKQHSDRVIHFEVETDHFLSDIDRLIDYEKLKSAD